MFEYHLNQLYLVTKLICIAGSMDSYSPATTIFWKCLCRFSGPVSKSWNFKFMARNNRKRPCFQTILCSFGYGWRVGNALSQLLWNLPSVYLFSQKTIVLLQVLEICSEPCQTSKMEPFVMIINGCNLWTVFIKCSILVVWKGFEYTFEQKGKIFLLKFFGIIRISK